MDKYDVTVCIDDVWQDGFYPSGQNIFRSKTLMDEKKLMGIVVACEKMGDLLRIQRPDSQ